MTEWAREIGLSLSALWHRVNNGWPIGKALSTRQTHSSQRRYITHNGKTKNLSQWAREIGISRVSLEKRLNSGWPIDKALSVPKHAGRLL